MVKPQRGAQFNDRLRQLRTDIDVIKFRATRDEVEKELNELIYDIEEKFSIAEEGFRDLSRSDRDSRQQMKSRFERAWAEAAYAIDRAKARLLH